VNRKEAIELLPIIQAFAEGKDIEYRTKGFNEDWKKVTQIPALSFKSFEYRIKPEPKYRPFKNAEECLKEMSKHTPFGLIKKNVSGAFYCIGSFDIKNIYIGTTQGMHSYADSLENFKFADGLPFGVKVEE
jgi:hypothetical protein